MVPDAARRDALRALATLFAAHPFPMIVFAQQALKRLLALDFELIDDQAGDVPFPEGPARLAMISRRIREKIESEHLYEVVDATPVAGLIASVRKTQNLLNCSGCELEIARRAGADRILLGWVQKVSNLILNVNIEIRDAKTGETVLGKSVDLRGNTDVSWQRGVDFLVRDMVEKRQGNR
jgi:hypothetical protein